MLGRPGAVDVRAHHVTSPRGDRRHRLSRRSPRALSQLPSRTLPRTDPDGRAPGASQSVRSRTLRLLDRPAWPAGTELRVGLGCMRLSTDAERDESLALETIAAAVSEGSRCSTPRTRTAAGGGLGHNGRLGGLPPRRGRGVDGRVVTGGMSRPGGAWVADGRAKAIRADCEGEPRGARRLPYRPLPRPRAGSRTPWQTSVRALARLVDDGLVRHVGVSNVTRRQLDEALELAPIAAVEVAINPFDDRAIRGGSAAVRRDGDRGDRPLAARRPGSRGAPRAAAEVAAVAGRRRDPGRGGPRVAARPLAGRDRDPGRRRPESARSAARAAELEARRPPARRSPTRSAATRHGVSRGRARVTTRRSFS